MKFHLMIANLSLMLWISGCAIIGNSPPTRFYILPSASTTPAASAIRETIGLAPISLPRYLDRPQIVTIDEGGQVMLAEFHRWAEPLSAGFSRVLTKALTARLPNKAILPATPEIEQILEIQVQDFRAQPGRCVLTAIWRLRRGKEALTWHHQTIEQPVQGQGYPALVAAMGLAIEQLAERIATALE